MKLILNSLLLFVIIMITACAHYNEGTVMVDNPALIQFTGDPMNVYVMVDENKIDLTIYKEKQLKETRFNYTEGTHIISIYKNNVLISTQSAFLEKGKIFQVRLP